MLRVLTAVALAFGMIASATPAPATQSAKVSHATRARIVAFSHVTESQIRRLIAVIGLPREAICDPNSSTPTQVNCVAVNSSGALSVTATAGSTASPGVFRLQDGTTTNLAFVSSSGVLAVAPCSVALTCQTFLGAGQDALTNTLTSAVVTGENYGFNGVSWERTKTLAAITGSGTGVLAVGQEPQTPTYTTAALTVANAGAGIFFTINGAASHVIRVRSCVLTGTATTATYDEIYAATYTSSATGGTSAATILGTMDSSNSATAATSLYWTSSPTAGTVQNVAYSQYMLLESATPGTQPQQLITMTWPNSENGEPPTLRSAAQQFALVTTSAVTGASWVVTCKFTDTAT